MQAAVLRGPWALLTQRVCLIRVRFWSRPACSLHNGANEIKQDVVKVTKPVHFNQDLTWYCFIGVNYRCYQVVKKNYKVSHQDCNVHKALRHNCFQEPGHVISKRKILLSKKCHPLVRTGSVQGRTHLVLVATFPNHPKSI